MPIPDIDPATGYLPADEYLATLDEVGERYATNYRRKEIFGGLGWVVDRLQQRDVEEIWIDGSFITERPRPSDVDVVYVPPPGADTDTWGLLSFGRRKALKDYKRVDLWPYPSPQLKPSIPPKWITIKEYFETDEDDIPKGIIKLDL